MGNFEHEAMLEIDVHSAVASSATRGAIAPDDEPHASAEPAGDARSATASKPLREISPDFLSASVLVIEDEVIIGMYVSSLLMEMGFSSVRLVASGAQALQAAEAQSFGLIVSDIILENSELNGIDVVALLMDINPVPVVFITAHAGPSEIQRISDETPRAALLRKPVIHREFHNAIAALVETWHPT
jgi:CheY-like chemotaxis protein